MEKSDIDYIQRLSFLANTVHEIRTPVQTIIGTLELLSDTNLNNEQQEYVRQIQFSTDVLLNLVNDILDFTKIKSQQISFEAIPYDVISLTERVADFISLEAFSKGIELVVDTDYTLPSLVMGDPMRIQQIILNIIKNAVKFTHKGYIHIELTRKNEDTMLFEVSDTGIGIPKDKYQNLFTAYYQAEASTTRKYGGTGLGLAICKGLINAMNGDIGIRENKDGGSIFWFTLPLVVAQNFPSDSQINIPSNERILVVDDNLLALQSINKKLNSLGIEKISTAQDAKEALQKMKNAEHLQNRFSTVFIDMSLPKVDGWHLAWEIRQQKQFNKIKLYLLVPEGQMGAEAKMKLINLFNGYIYKPVKRKHLQALFKDMYDIPSDVETVDVKQKANMDNSNNENIAEQMTVLVAEDHPLNRKLLATFLKKFGATVIEAEDGLQAVKKITENKAINMIFMDIQMPVMDGIEASKKLREERFSGIIIACTANNDEKDFESYRKIGMNDILIKPFKSYDIKILIEKWKAVIELPSAQEIAMLDTLTAPTNTAWDQKDFEDTIDGNLKLGKELISEYCKQIETIKEQIEKAILASDFVELRKIGHKIQGSSSAISANKLASCGSEINKNAKLQNIDAIKDSFEKLKNELTIFELSSEKWCTLQENISNYGDKK